MYSIKMDRIAEEELIAIYRYISDKLQSPITAKNMMSRLRVEINSLDSYPTGTLAKEATQINPEIRKLKVKNYFIFFTVEEFTKTVRIRHIIYSRRNWQTLI
jgi:plasmid stabilization system protein ParE